jgi:hypothetical protein
MLRQTECRVFGLAVQLQLPLECRTPREREDLLAELIGQLPDGYLGEVSRHGAGLRTVHAAAVRRPTTSVDRTTKRCEIAPTRQPEIAPMKAKPRSPQRGEARDCIKKAKLEIAPKR